MFSGNKPDCIACGFVIVIPENFVVVEILDTYHSCFMDGMGGINTIGIDTVLEWEGLEKDPGLIQKIIIYLLVSSKKQSEESKHGQENRTGISSKGQGFGGNKRRHK